MEKELQEEKTSRAGDVAHWQSQALGSIPSLAKSKSIKQKDQQDNGHIRKVTVNLCHTVVKRLR